MQVKFGEFNAVQNEDIQQIHPDEIAGYLIKRSPTNKALFNVFAVDDNYEPLFCVESDLSLEEAQQKVDAVNKEYFPVVQALRSWLRFNLRMNNVFLVQRSK